MRLELYDFDGTITSKDTLFEFIRFYHGKGRFYKGFLQAVPKISMFYSGLLANWQLKEYILKIFFGGEEIKVFNNKCLEFCTTVLPEILRHSALKSVYRSIEEKNRIIIVSASPENWIKPWCDKLGIELLATKLEVIENKLTGKLNGYNCYGEEKVNRIKQHVDLSQYKEIYAFGDTKGDNEMLALATKQFYRYFDS